jgi:rhamnulokinase
VGQGVHFLSVDLGAESGRVVLGCFDGERLSLREAHRFDSRPVRVPDGLHTDVLRIFNEIESGLAAAAAQADGPIAGVAVDTWGVDFALLDAEGTLLGNPYHYRDGFSERATEAAFRHVSREEVYRRTGNGFMPINTLFQLFALKLRRAPALAAASRLLMMPDLFTYWLSGCMTNELTIASTSQCLDPWTRTWAVDLLERLGLPTAIFGEIVPPGTVVGSLLRSLADRAGIDRVPVIAAAGHDTALAVAAVPARGADFAFLSSGTWSLLGTELAAPRVDSHCYSANFTNEAGVFGATRFLKNLCGLWLVQECRRAWGRGGRLDSWDELTWLAAAAPACRSLVDVDDPAFALAGEMPARIQDYCRRTGQPVPEGKGAIVRCALDSLALKYRAVLEELECVLGRRLEPLYVVGGGTRNELLCQLAADATGREVVAGPVEATAAGSVVMQAIAIGQLGSLAEGRELVRRSFDVTSYEPRDRGPLQEACGRLRELPRLSSPERDC